MTHWPQIAKSLLGLTLLMSQAGCLMRSKSSTLLDQSQTWADAKVVLSRPDTSYQLMLQTFSPPWEITQETKFNLFAVREQEGVTGKRFNVFYADQDQPGDYRSLTYQLETYVGYDRRTIEVYAWVFQRTPSHEDALQQDLGQGGIRGPYSEAQRFYLGQAVFSNNDDRVVPMRMFDRLANSPALIYGPKDFKGNGQIAIHFMKDVVYKDPPAEAVCEGQNNCDTLPLAELCRNDILNSKCRPALPPQPEWLAFKALGRAERLTALGDGVFALEKNQSSGRLVFTSQAQAATVDGNQKLCDDRVTFLIRDGSGSRNNAACRIQKEPSTNPTSGLMTCAASVSFQDPRDVHEYGCNVTAVIRGPKKEFQSVQILYLVK